MKTLESNFFKNFFKKNPLNIIDVGSAGGLLNPWRDIKKSIKIVSFEPRESEDSMGLALSDHEGQEVMHITKSSYSSSLLLPDNEILHNFLGFESYEVIKDIPVKIDTIDNQLIEKNISSIDFIKVDTQGTELKILTGAEEVLKKSVFGIEVEINFISRYKGQDFFSDIDKYLKKHNFELFDIQRRYTKYAKGYRHGGPQGRLTHGNAVYFKDLDAFKSQIDELSNNDKKTKIIKYISIVLLYGYVDYAFHVVKFFEQALGPDFLKKLQLLLEKEKYISLDIPNFRGRHKIAQFFAYLTNFFQPRSDSGIIGDQCLGNYRKINIWRF